MSDFIFVKAELEIVNVKEEYLEEEDPLMITSNTIRGKGNRPKKNLAVLADMFAKAFSPHPFDGHVYLGL